MNYEYLKNIFKSQPKVQQCLQQDLEIVWTKGKIRKLQEIYLNINTF